MFVTVGGDTRFVTMGAPGGGAGNAPAAAGEARRRRQHQPVLSRRPAPHPSPLPAGGAREEPSALTGARLTEIYVDADACPVREEVYRVAGRHRDRRLRRLERVAADPPAGSVLCADGGGRRGGRRGRRLDRRADRRGRCLRHRRHSAGARCLAKGARVVPPTGRPFTKANIGNALAGREIARHLRELGAASRGPAPFTKADRSRFSRSRCRGRGRAPCSTASLVPRCRSNPLVRANDPLASARSPADGALGFDIERIDRLARRHEQAVALRAAETDVGAALGQAGCGRSGCRRGRRPRPRPRPSPPEKPHHTLPSMSTRMPSA